MWNPRKLLFWIGYLSSPKKGMAKIWRDYLAVVSEDSGILTPK
jgi:hypothetical protein